MIGRDLREYYARRASEYERVYTKPERQGDLARLTTLLREMLRGHDVLEVACGTGYWTRVTAQVAHSVVATDGTPETIAIAQAQEYPRGRVRFAVADAFALGEVGAPFTAGFAGFWWSHVPRERLAAFLESWHRAVGPEGLIVVADNLYVEGSNSPIKRRDDHGNTYQQRTLDNGQQFEVLKNFPTEAELRGVLQDHAWDVSVTSFTYYWCMTYRVAGTL
jgi:demethylmenaquinone methyltransferase/2-methoxy-6-polyprenyl-1,4-benzoquinol methylase